MIRIVTALAIALAPTGATIAEAQEKGGLPLPKGLDLKQLFRTVTVTRCPTAPDPSYVNGFMAFEDPATGQPWVPSLNGEASGWVVNYNVFFRSRTNPDDVMSLGARNGEGIMGSSISGVFYVVRLNADRNAGRPTKPPERNPLVITYNPDQWCFDRIEVDPNINRNGFETLRQRSANFPTLRDRPICRTDGYCLEH